MEPTASAACTVENTSVFWTCSWPVSRAAARSTKLPPLPTLPTTAARTWWKLSVEISAPSAVEQGLGVELRGVGDG
ncbi:MAG: hypothetical protein R3F46_00240 [bacterium]